MRLRKTNPGDLPQLKALWALGFGDTEREIEAFFAISYPTATGFCAEDGGRLIAAAYALPQELAWGEKSCRAAYLYAVTTHPDCRRQGVCAKLLAYAEKELKKRYFDGLTLVPATDALRAYYASLGFVSQNAAFLTRATRRRRGGSVRRWSPPNTQACARLCSMTRRTCAIRSPICAIRRPCPAFTGWSSARTMAARARIWRGKRSSRMRSCRTAPSCPRC